MKICSVEAELFHTDGWPDVQAGTTKLVVAFYSFTNEKYFVVGFTSSFLVPWYLS